MKTEAKKNSGAFRDIPYMGVIYVVAEAMKLGFYNGHPDWSNLGQGQPEVGDIEGAPPRVDGARFEPEDHAYGPIGGTDELRHLIAEHYNRLYRHDKPSKYGAENVSVASGGRLMLSRVFAAIDDGNLGYLYPDYTAYEDMMDSHRHRFEPCAIRTYVDDGFIVTADRLEREIIEQQLRSFVFSNPCNPTGRVVRGKELAAYVDLARGRDCTMVFDEFYSHFIYNEDGTPGAGPVSAAEYVDDVESDPVLLIDGLTKSFRYPGWRVGWAVGPSHMIETLGRAASAIDGGPSRPMQRAAMEVLEPRRADQETHALRQVFVSKRNYMLEMLRGMGIECPHPSDATFYVWASIAGLPAAINDGDTFFRAALEEKVLTVPGVFFDVNPGKLRKGPSPFRQWVRFSFGPPADNVAMGLDRLAGLIERHR